MASLRNNILWVDDEIDLLRPHIMFMQDKGFNVTPVTNAADAIDLISRQRFDLVLLDEQMAGMDGLTALQEMKDINPALPIVMVTKSEEESLMEEAIAARIDDYLTKPVNPSQILLICKKILEKKQITSDRFSRDYATEFNQLSMRLLEPMTHQDWVDVAIKMANWDIELDQHDELGLHQTLADQRRECNAEFGRFVEKNYIGWLQGENSPVLSVDLFSKYVIPRINEGKKVVFVVIDNLRLDQWLVIEPSLYDHFSIQKDYYFSILPTATPYSRNAIFAGLYPAEIEQMYPEYWSDKDDETSLNRFEKELMDEQLKRENITLQDGCRYIKVLDVNEAKNTEKNIASLADLSLFSLVVNFVDILAHSRSDSKILREIIPDEAAYRSLTKSWFTHSFLFRILKELAEHGNTVVLTTDHGSLRGMRGTKVVADRHTSTNLRYKFGRNLKTDKKYAIVVKDPSLYKLPSSGINTNFIIAKEDYYFVYPTNYHHYLNYYKDSLQHGGISIEEMILPVVILEPKNA
ncbi:MAG: PglZ domain-containing protein [Deferribacteres bacterium]|nr:PglZ domain-containing protein [candidate division KSB1 bacterium]MCB9504252.1 PglZ domain-containing protein [Deferribacteres bacterium]